MKLKDHVNGDPFNAGADLVSANILAEFLHGVLKIQRSLMFK